jgi:hypothetical protein
MTVSKDHTFNIDLADKLLDNLEVTDFTEVFAFHIYYVLPADVYDDFKCPPSGGDGRVQCFKLKMISY